MDDDYTTYIQQLLQKDGFTYITGQKRTSFEHAKKISPTVHKNKQTNKQTQRCVNNKKNALRKNDNDGAVTLFCRIANPTYIY